MTIRELKGVTKCPVFIERIDGDGVVQREEYLRPGFRDWQVISLRIIHEKMRGFALCVELGEEV